ncbi:hypothetical protein PRZ48_002544 [Zasmidium cellare]|uniref:Uncharacterized protein n=1 Tax=Zasmidium cellare TaxID=395010 RepID=A0ABR0F575_ZASCE|nr:hypothetical protein PRZ48_002544 [Zasmidium cellare]
MSDNDESFGQALRCGQLFEMEKVDFGPLYLPETLSHIRFHDRERANLDFKAKLREGRDAALKEKRKAENRKARQKQISNAKAKIVAKARADRAAEKLVAQHGGNRTRRKARVGAHAHDEKKAQTHDKHGFGKTTSSSAVIKVKRREKKEHVKTLRTRTEKECNEQLKTAQNDSYLATASAIAYENSQKFLMGSSGNVSLSTQTRALSKESEAKKWIESQNTTPAYRERARLERKGVYVSESSPEWDSLILTTRAKIIEEAGLN